jgi:hypothetical protein
LAARVIVSPKFVLRSTGLGKALSFFPSINYTAPCDEEAVGASVCAVLADLTDFEQSSLAHMPAMDFSEGSETTEESDADGEVTIDYVLIIVNY